MNTRILTIQYHPGGIFYGNGDHQAFARLAELRREKPDIADKPPVPILRQGKHMKLISLFIGISLHPFVIVPGLIGGLFIRSHLWRAVFLIVCCVFFSAILKQGPQWVAARLLGYFGVAYLAYGIKKIVLMRQAAMAWERRRNNPDGHDNGLPQKGFFARTPAKRLGLLLLGGSIGILLLDVLVWAGTKNVSEKLWDFFSPSSFHGSLAWLCFAAFALGVLLFFGKGGKLAKWISTGYTNDDTT